MESVASQEAVLAADANVADREEAAYKLVADLILRQSVEMVQVVDESVLRVDVRLMGTLAMAPAPVLVSLYIMNELFVVLLKSWQPELEALRSQIPVKL